MEMPSVRSSLLWLERPDPLCQLCALQTLRQFRFATCFARVRARAPQAVLERAGATGLSLRALQEPLLLLPAEISGAYDAARGSRRGGIGSVGLVRRLSRARLTLDKIYIYSRSCLNSFWQQPITSLDSAVFACFEARLSLRDLMSKRNLGWEARKCEWPVVGVGTFC
jgi:hypothetical protein